MIRAAFSRFFFSGAHADRLGATRLVLGFGFALLFGYEYAPLFIPEPFGPAIRHVDPIYYFEALAIRRTIPWLSMLGALALTPLLIGFALGWRTRWCAVAALLLIPLLKGARDSVAGDVHHRELIPYHLLFFFACSRSGEVISLDALRAGARAQLAEWEASWPIKASQLYVATFYFWSGVAKLRATGIGWFDADVVRYEIFERAVRFGVDGSGAPRDASLGHWVASFPALLLLPSAGVAVMELGFPIVLWLRARARDVFLGGVAVFHVANFVLMNVHFLLMPIAFLVYFDPSAWLARRIPALFPGSRSP